MKAADFSYEVDLKLKDAHWQNQATDTLWQDGSGEIGFYTQFDDIRPGEPAITNCTYAAWFVLFTLWCWAMMK